MKKRWKLLLLALVSLLVLAGWSQKKVELLSDKKLIDLSAAIGNCTLGADDMTPDEGTSERNPNGQGAAKPTPKPTPKPTAMPTPMISVTPKPTITPGATSPHAPTIHPKPTVSIKPRTLDISVRDEQVTYNYVLWPYLDILKERLQRDHDERTSFCLIDDYAEAHVYRRMLEILNELEAEIGLRYTIK